MRSCCVFDSLRLLHFPLFAARLLSDRPVFPFGHQLHLPRCDGQIPCALKLMRTFGTLAEYDPLTGYEPNEYHSTEAYVEYTQESTSEQRSPNNFDYDDVTIGKALSDACRRRADHSHDEAFVAQSVVVSQS